MEIEKEMMASGTTQDVLDLHWKALAKYKTVFEKFVFQNTIVSMQSHWDWYLRRLGVFILFARQAVADPPLASKSNRDLKRIGSANFADQIHILRESTGLPVLLPTESVERVREIYLKQSKFAGPCTVGDIRAVESPELLGWHEDLMKVVNATWPPIAERCVLAPDFTG